MPAHRPIAAFPAIASNTASVAPSRLVSQPRILRLNDPQRCIAIARSGPFWFEPFFAAAPSTLASTGDIALFLWQRTDGTCGALLPLIGEHGRAVLRADAQRGLVASWENDRGARASGTEPAFTFAVDRDPITATHLAVAAARESLGTFAPRQSKRVPDFIDYLGWCTWDAFYKEVSAAGIARGLAKLARGGVKPGFLIIDDGWQQVRADRMVDFATDTKKFPRGLAPVIRIAKEKFGVRRVGVWHALQGYWQGVDPRGPLARRYRVLPCCGRSPEFSGWPAQFDTARRDLVAPADAARFYHDFHRWLRSEGVDFVKVDNQAMMQQFAGKNLPRLATAAAYQRALQGATSVHFGGALLHCMSNYADALLHLSTSALWRNSQDFYPKKSDAFQAAYVTWNAYNNLLSAPFAQPDWDMFQTTRHHAHYHACARAISGGPIYISDAPGQHDFKLLRRLVLPDGRVPRWSQPARPAIDRIFEDPRSGKRLLKVVNASSALGAVALFHTGLADKDTLQTAPISDTFSPADLPSLPPSARYVALGSESGRVLLLGPRERATVELAPLAAEIFTVAPVDRGVAALGLAGMLNGGAALGETRWISRTEFRAHVLGGGTALFHTDRAPALATVAGRRVRPKRDAHTGLLRVPLPASCALLEIILTFRA